MQNYPSKSRVKLDIFPDYTCCFYHSSLNFSKEMYDVCVTPTIVVYNQYGGWDDKLYRLIPEERLNSSGLRIRARGTLEEGDRLLLHPKCDIPALSISSKYKVISSRSDTVANKIVVPYRRPQPWNTIGGCIIPFINHKDKVILLVGMGRWFTETDLTPTEAEIFLSMSRIDISVGGFKALDQEKLKMYRLTDMDAISYALMSGMIPRDKVISDMDVPVKGDPITKELIYNAYKLLNSSDNQLRETACMTLAQHNCKGYEELIGWLLWVYRKQLYGLKARNAAFRWLTICCDEYYVRQGQFYQYKSNEAAKWFVEQLTGGKIHWNEDGAMVVEDKRMNAGFLKVLTDHIR